MIAIHVHDYSTGDPEVRIYYEDQIEEASEDSGNSIEMIKHHISEAKASSRNVIAYLAPSTWKIIMGGPDELSGR